MKKIVNVLLCSVLILGIGVGCKNQQEKPQEESVIQDTVFFTEGIDEDAFSAEAIFKEILNELELEIEEDVASLGENSTEEEWAELRIEAKEAFEEVRITVAEEVEGDKTGIEKLIKESEARIKKLLGE